MARASDNLDQFLRATSHDFKEPINTIRFYLGELNKHQKVRGEHDLKKMVQSLSRKTGSLLTKFSNFYEAYKKSNNTGKFLKEVNGPISRQIEQMEDIWQQLYPQIDYISFADLDNLHISRLDIAFQRMISRLSGLQRYLRVSDQPEKTVTSVRDEIKLVVNDLTAQFDREYISTDCVTIDGQCTDRFDRVLLGALFQNLISNSIKYRIYNRSLRIRIQLGVVRGGLLASKIGKLSQFVDDRNDDTFNYFIYEDNAKGVPFKFVESIFDPYFQLDRDERERDSGAGMGLAIVKSVVNIHEGEVILVSQEGMGSRFLFATKRRNMLTRSLDEERFIEAVSHRLGDI